MFANRFTAVLDACVLVGMLKRDIILSLAEADLFRPRWSIKILDETEIAISKIIEKKNLENAPERAKHQRVQIDKAFADATIEDYESLIPILSALPDKDDAHVVAVAIKTKASIIVTDNLKDFPVHVLQPLEIEAKSADDFIADTFDLSQPTALSCLKALRERYKNPAYTTQKLLTRMEEVGLPQTADFLREHQDLW